MLCWQQPVNLGPKMGGVQDVPLVRLPQAGGMVVVTAHTTLELLGLSKGGLKSLVQRINPDMRGMYEVDDEEVDFLVSKGATKRGGRNAGILLTIHVLSTLAREVLGEEAPLEALKALASTKPQPAAPLLLPNEDEPIRCG